MGILDKMIGGDYESRSATRQAEEAMDIMKRDYPQLMQMLTGQKMDEAQGDLNVAKAVTPGYNDLAMSEMERLTPRASALQGAMDTEQARADIERMSALGPDAGRALRAADESANAEFYANLKGTGDKYSQLLNELSPTMTAGQRAEIERGVSRMNPNGPDNSAVSLAEKASAFGSGHQANLANFANILNGISSNLSSLKTGLNPANLTLGRDSRTAPVTGAITPVVKAPTNAQQIGTGMYGQQIAGAQNHDSINAQMFKSWGDVLGQTSQTFSNIAGGVTKLKGN